MLLLSRSSIFDIGILQESNQTNSAENASSPDVLVGLNNGGLGETLAGVVEKVLDTADGVVDKGETKSELETTLDGKGKTGDEASDAQALEVETDDGSGEVGERETVEGDGESRAGDTVPGGATEPCLLELVDGQMGRDGSVEALVNEDLLTILLRDLDGTSSAVHILDRDRSSIALVDIPGGRRGRNSSSQSTLGDVLSKERLGRA
jgi:hypothetical protein